jgi:hypothetical protein
VSRLRAVSAIVDDSAGCFPFQVFKRANPFELRFVARSQRPVVSVSRKVTAGDLMAVLEQLRGRRSPASSPSSFVPDDLVLQQQAEKAMTQWASSSEWIDVR